MTRKDMILGPFWSRQQETATRVTLAASPSTNGDKTPKPSHRSILSATDVASYAEPYIKFSSENPTIFHVIAYFSNQLKTHGFTLLSERESWSDKLQKGGKYLVQRNGSSLIAFIVGPNYAPGNGAAIIGSHADALHTKLKPISKVPNKAGYVQLGVAPYAGALSAPWWDRDLGVGGRVLVKDKKTGKIETKLVKLPWPIARIPTLAVHFGAASDIHGANKETRMVPIIGLDNTDLDGKQAEVVKPSLLAEGKGSFVSTQPPRLVKAITRELGIGDWSTIVNWELELFDTQPAQLGGLDKEFIFAGRLDDRLCSFAAIEGLIASFKSSSANREFSDDDSGILKIVGLFDDEEIGSQLRQGAMGTLLPITIDRIVQHFSNGRSAADLLARTYANSFLISADVGHAVNPNYLDSYLENHSPRLNVGVAVQYDPNGLVSTDSVSAALLQRIADKSDSVLQAFQIRNDSRSGTTIGPMLSTNLGVRAIDAGISQLSMHSIRATTGNLDPGLGVKLFKGFFDYFEEVDQEFE